MPLVRSPDDEADLVKSIMTSPIQTAKYIIRLEDDNQRMREVISNLSKVLMGGPKKG